MAEQAVGVQGAARLEVERLRLLIGPGQLVHQAGELSRCIRVAEPVGKVSLDRRLAWYRRRTYCACARTANTRTTAPLPLPLNCTSPIASTALLTKIQQRRLPSWL